MYWLKRPFIWLSRIHRCRGFGIQSPTDYWMVRYVINEHWPYYQYKDLGRDDDELTRKLGRLYFRLANWRQPTVIESDGYHEYLQAGCHGAVFGRSEELACLTVDDGERLTRFCDKADERSVLVVEGIDRDRGLWRRLSQDERTGITYDLYYCGIVLFDKRRHKQAYIVNF